MLWMATPRTMRTSRPRMPTQTALRILSSLPKSKSNLVFCSFIFPIMVEESEEGLV